MNRESCGDSELPVNPSILTLAGMTCIYLKLALSTSRAFRGCAALLAIGVTEHGNMATRGAFTPVTLHVPSVTAAYSRSSRLQESVFTSCLSVGEAFQRTQTLLHAFEELSDLDVAQ
jgi:hypothetical protein